MLLFWEVALGITPSRGRVYVSPDFTLVHAHNTGRRTHLLSVCLQRKELRQRSGSPALRATFFPPIGRLFEPVTPFPRPLWISNNRVQPVQNRLFCQRYCCCHLGNAQTEGKSGSLLDLFAKKSVSAGFSAPWSNVGLVSCSLDPRHSL